MRRRSPSISPRRQNSLKVALVGLALEYYEQRSPCLALYNLKMYALTDPDLPGRVVFSLHDLPVAMADDAVLDRLAALAPDVVGLSCYVWSSARLIAIAERLAHRLPKANIFLGGPDAGPRAALLLGRHPFVAGVVAGEGEEPFRLLLRRLAGIDADDWKGTPGLAVRSGEKTMLNPGPGPIDLDRLPIALADEDFRRNHGAWLYMETSRGCRYRCAYCNFAALDASWRMRSLESIYRAIDAAEAEGGRFVTFLDAGFNQDLERFRAVVDYLDRHPRLAFDALEINIEGMEEKDIQRLARMTAGSLGIGLQTTHPPALRAIGRRYDPEKFKSRIAFLRRCGVDFNIDLICGLPADGLATFLQSVDDAYALKPTLVIIFRLHVLPGTRFAREADRWGLRFDPEPPYLVIANDTFHEAEIEGALRVVRANMIMSTSAPNTHAFQLAASELGKRPSELLRAFVAGAWRGGGPLPEECLTRWRETAHIEETIAAVEGFFRHQFEAAGREMPVALRELFALQFATGRLNCIPFPGKPAPRERPLADGMTLATSPMAVLLEAQTDLLRLQKERCPLADAAVEPHRLLLHRRGKTTVTSRVPDAIAQLIRSAGSGNRVGDIIEKTAASFPDGDRSRLCEKLRGGLAELVDRGVLRVV